MPGFWFFFLVSLIRAYQSTTSVERRRHDAMKGTMLFTGLAIQLLLRSGGETANKLVDESPCRRCRYTRVSFAQSCVTVTAPPIEIGGILGCYP
jgi:hypothetical protein